VNNLLPILYILGLYSAFVAGVILLRNRLSVPRSNTREFHFPRTTLLLLLAVAVPSALQLFFPVVLSLFERDYERFLSGDWWRLVTPLFVQDGGVAGTIFNLVSLLLVGSVAERLWGGRYMLIIFFIGGIIGEIVAFTWQPVGAGNSIGNFSLAASIAMASLTRHPSRSIQIGAVFALGADGLLVGLQDIHGAAAIVGAILGLILSQLWHGKD
jgi:membrane associated rhomboid family serine protease